jgi:hypothetical protein
MADERCWQLLLSEAMLKGMLLGWSINILVEFIFHGTPVDLIVPITKKKKDRLEAMPDGQDQKIDDHGANIDGQLSLQD